MTVFIYNIKRIFRNRLGLLFMMVLPLIFISLNMMGNSNGGRVNVGIIDNDKTELTRTLINDMKMDKNSSIVDIQESEMQDELFNSKIDCAFSIDKGFTDGLINGEDVKIKSFSVNGTNVSKPINMYIESFLNSAKNIASAAGGDSGKFYTGIKAYDNGVVAADYNILGGSKNKRTRTATSMGFLILCMLMFASDSSQLVLEDKKRKTFERVFSTPLSMRSYMFQNILSYFVMLVIQAAAIFAIMIYAFDADFGPSVLNMFIFFMVFALVSTSLGVAISGISKDGRQASVLSTLIIMPVCMLGGCFWPREIMPDILKSIGNFVPTTWAMEGSAKVLNSGVLSSSWHEILVMLLFSLVFFLIGILPRVDVSK